jgi:MmyB-like transcription regulator ligand binding domain
LSAGRSGGPDPRASHQRPSYPRTGARDFHHPVVGDLTLTYEMLDVSADSGLALLMDTAEPDSKSGEALDLLASSTTTIDDADVAEISERPS